MAERKSSGTVPHRETPKKHAKSEVRGEDGARPAPDRGGASDFPGDSRASDARATFRRVVLRDLTMQERLLLVLLYVERMSRLEAAATLHMLPEQVDGMVERVLARLRHVLRNQSKATLPNQC